MILLAFEIPAVWVHRCKDAPTAPLRCVFALPSPGRVVMRIHSREKEREREEGQRERY